MMPWGPSTPTRISCAHDGLHAHCRLRDVDGVGTFNPEHAVQEIDSDGNFGRLALASVGA
jgi:hypothetical protein